MIEAAATHAGVHAAARAPDPGTYTKGKLRAAGILDAAITLLIERGYHNLSMRKVADQAGVRLGNLQHYFPTRDDLVKAMLDRMIEGYLDRFEQIRGVGGDPEREFGAIVESVILDLNKRRTTVFFPELWSLSNHEPHVTQYMDQMYERYRQVLGDAIARMNPALTAAQVRRLALFVSASIEGHTAFIGYRKPWRAETPHVIDMALQSFVWLIRNGRIPD